MDKPAEFLTMNNMPPNARLLQPVSSKERISGGLIKHRASLSTSAR
jgi:hypothetical protein